MVWDVKTFIFTPSTTGSYAFDTCDTCTSDQVIVASSVCGGDLTALLDCDGKSNVICWASISALIRKGNGVAGGRKG